MLGIGRQLKGDVAIHLGWTVDLDGYRLALIEILLEALPAVRAADLGRLARVGG
jgi:hypothetical protein